VSITEHRLVLTDLDMLNCKRRRTMRKLLSLVILAGVLVCAGARVKKPKLPEKGPDTKLEAFETQTGRVIIRGRSDIGSVSGMGTVSVDCIEIIDVSNGVREMGIVIEVKASGSYERTDSSFIDFDEIESLLNGIDYIYKVTPNSTKLSRFEATYKTKGELSIVTFERGPRNIEAAVSSGSIGAVTAFISREKLTELRSVIAKAKQKLDEIK